MKGYLRRARRRVRKPFKKLNRRYARWALRRARERITRVGLKKSVGEHVREFGPSVTEARPFLNVGPGKWNHPCWMNLDILQPKYSANPPDILHDLMTESAIPLESESLQAIYASHVIEHISDAANRVLFVEAHRILKKGGLLRLVFPDVDRAFAAFTQGDRYFFVEGWPRPGHRELQDVELTSLFLEFFARDRIGEPADPPVEGDRRFSDEELRVLIKDAAEQDAIEAFYEQMTTGIPVELQRRAPGNHRNWFNVDKAMRMLREAGFEIVERSAYRQSRLYALRNATFFDQTQPEFSGYVEAVKGR